VNIQQKGTNASTNDVQVIVPNISFSCNGRITGYLISLGDGDEDNEDEDNEDDNEDEDNEDEDNDESNFPVIQVWHPTSSTVYTRVDTECALTDSDISRMRDSMGDRYYLGNVSCTENTRIEFQSGDVLGYYQGDDLHYRMWNIETMEHTYYYYHIENEDEDGPLTSFNLSNADNDIGRPLIQLIFGKNITLILLLLLNHNIITYITSNYSKSFLVASYMEISPFLCV